MFMISQNIQSEKFVIFSIFGENKIIFWSHSLNVISIRNYRVYTYILDYL